MGRGTVDDAQRLLEEMSARPRPPGRDCWIFIERAIDVLDAMPAKDVDLRARLEDSRNVARVCEQRLEQAKDVIRQAEQERDAARADLGVELLTFEVARHTRRQERECGGDRD